jgi:hypothetical protein
MTNVTWNLASITRRRAFFEVPTGRRIPSGLLHRGESNGVDTEAVVAARWWPRVLWFSLQREMHALVPTVLLRVPGRARPL